MMMVLWAKSEERMVVMLEQGLMLLMGAIKCSQSVR
jgi:hypothetical protein